MKLTEQDYMELTNDLSNALSMAFDYGVKFVLYNKDVADPLTVDEVKAAQEARCRMFDRICSKLAATVYRDEPIPYKREEVLA